MSLGKNIARLRKLQHLRSKDLAEMVGVKQPYISAIENGKKTPSIEVLQKIALALNTTTSDLLGETSEILSEDLKKLVIAAKELNKSQVEAIISMVQELTENYKK